MITLTGYEILIFYAIEMFTLFVGAYITILVLKAMKRLRD